MLAQDSTMPFQKPGGGKSSKALKKGEFPANVVPDGAFGKIDAAKAAKLKANPKRPAPLKRKLKAKLPKADKKKLREAREVAKNKYKERSESFKKDRVYLKNRLKTLHTHTARKMSEWASKLHAAKLPSSQTEKKSKNFTLIYAVGPQNEERRKCFREFRQKKRAELKAMAKAGKSCDVTSVKVATKPTA